MTHKKILFTDLDGTLLRNDKSISSFTRDTIKRWTESGNYFALSSGRDLNSTLKVKEDLQLNFQNVFAIGYNGGQIFDCTKNETIYKITLKIEQVDYLFKKAKEAGIYVHTYSDKNIIVAEKTKETEFYTRVIKTPVLVSKDLKLTEPPCKAIIINLDDKEKLEKFRLSLLPWAEENDLSILYSNPWYVEIFPKKSGKGNAVKKLVDLIGLPELISVAAGDEENDISMIEAADIGIAMKNGKDSVKKVADVITDFSNDDDGLAKAIEKFLETE